LTLAVFAAGELGLRALKSTVKYTRVSAVDAAARAFAVKIKRVVIDTSCCFPTITADQL
jgi:hypothetical protein